MSELGARRARTYRHVTNTSAASVAGQENSRCYLQLNRLQQQSRFVVRSKHRYAPVAWCCHLVN